MHDQTIEERLRSTLRDEADHLPLTITSGELERRLAVRRRDRLNRRFGAMAAGVAAVLVGGALIVATNPFRATQVATTPAPSSLPSVVPSVAPPAAPPTSQPTSGPPTELRQITASADAVDSKVSEVKGDPSSTDDVPSVSALDNVRATARQAGITIVCLGPDPLALTWGIDADSTSIADETVTCDNTASSFRYDIAARQPLIGDALLISATPRTSYRVIVETFGYINDPTPTALPEFATPGGTVLIDGMQLFERAYGTMPAGTVPPRVGYRVAFACLGPGNATWSIGAQGTRGFIDRGEVVCDGAARGFISEAGLPSVDSDVSVTIEPYGTWHLIITDPYGAPPFIPPSLGMWAGADMEGAPSSGPARCVGWDDHVDSCAGVHQPRDGARVIGVPRGSDVTLMLTDGWRLTSAALFAVDRQSVRSDPYQAGGQMLETVTKTADRLTLSVAGLDPGEWILKIVVNGAKGGHTFQAFYEIPLRVSS